jgi:hypothetical protein
MTIFWSTSEFPPAGRRRRVVVDHHLVDLREPVDVALGQVIEVHPEAPVRVAHREPAEGGHLLHPLVVEDLEGGLPEVEAVAAA